MMLLPDPYVTPFMKVAELVPILGRKRSAAYLAVQRGDVPGVLRLGRNILIRTSAVYEMVGLPLPDRDAA